MPNEYLQMMEEQAASDDARFQASTSTAITVNPDQVAKVRATASYLGVPPAAVVGEPEDAERLAKTRKLTEDTAAAPTLRARYTDADFAKLAHDDSGPLSAIEKTVRSLFSRDPAPGEEAGLYGTVVNSSSRGISQLLNSFSVTGLRGNSQALGTLDRIEKGLAGGRAPGSFKADEDPFSAALMTPEQRANLRSDLMRQLQRQAGDVATRNDIAAGVPRRAVVDEVFNAGKAQGLQGMERFPAVWQAFTKDPVGFIASIGPESAVGNAPGLVLALPAGIAFGPAGAATMMGGGSFTTDYAASIQEALQTAGGDTADREALLRAVQNPDLMRNVGRQAFAHAAIVGAVDAASTGVASKVALPGGMLARQPLARELANLAVQAPTQGTLGAAGEFGGQVAAGQEIDPANILAEFAGEFFGTPAEVVSASAGQIGHRVATARIEAARAEATAAKVEQFAQVMEASKLRGRDAAEFSQFVAQIAEERGQAPSELYVDAQHLANVLNQSAMTITELRAIAPAMVDQLEAANNVPGADVRVPVAELAAAGPEVTTALLDHLREAPEAMSRAEARDFMASEGDHIQQQMQQALGQIQEEQAFRDSRTVVQEDVLQQLKATGRFSDAANGAYAALWANFFATQAARTGAAPHELYQRFGPKIVGQSRPGAVLDQDGAPRTIEIAGQRRPIVDNGGRLVGRTFDEQQNFWNWFGDSKAATVDGKPLVVYHGTSADFNVFDRSKAGDATGAANTKLGFFLTDRPDIADRYAGQGEGANTMPVYVSLHNPLQLHAPNMMEADKLLMAQLGDEHDGAVISVGEGERAQTVYMVRSENQIKSATGNDGSYNPGSPNILEQPAFHGSPHDFDRFSTDHIGTGEGAQAYGWGLYFAENASVATGYHRALAEDPEIQDFKVGRFEIVRKGQFVDYSPRDNTAIENVKGTIIESLLVDEHQLRAAQASGKLKEYVHEKIDGFINGYFNAETDKALIEAAKRFKKSVEQWGITFKLGKTTGGVYQVDIPDDVVAKMLLWDKPLSEQPPALQKALKEVKVPIDGWQGDRFVRAGIEDGYVTKEGDGYRAHVHGPGDQGVFTTREEAQAAVVAQTGQPKERTPNTGQELYQLLESQLGSDEAASKWLDKHGVPGVKYLDGGSRTDGEGTHNLVVFNDANVQLTHKDGTPVTAEERQAFFQPGDEATPRGSFDPSSNTLALLASADLSTLLHEGGHFFLEVQADLAARIAGAIQQGQAVSESERAIVADMTHILEWFGVQGSPQQTPLQQWLEMSLDEKRVFHEQWARGFERYLMEGEAPSLDMQAVFARFRAWLVQIYHTLTTLNAEISPDVREVMGRMLASDQAIAEAQAARDMGPMFQTPEQAGMTPEEYADYQRLAEGATARASAELDTRLLKDMKWLARARDKALKAAQATAAAARTEVEREVRAQVMAEPIYQAWTFLTAKPVLAQDQSAREESARAVRDWQHMRDEAQEAALRAERQKLYAAHPEVKGLAKGQLAAKNKRQIHIDVQQRMLEWDRANPKPAMAPLAVEDMGAEFATGKLNTEAVKRLAPPALETLKKLKMLAADGLAPDTVAELFGFASGEQLVKGLALAPSPSEAIHELTDQRMLERHGDITSQEALQRAADVAVHNELRARVIAHELKALAKANTVRETGDSLHRRETADVLAKAARDFAEKVVARQRIKDLRPAQYAAAEARSAKLATQALGKSTEEAAMHKRNQLVNNLAAKAAYEAQHEVQQGREFFRKVMTGARDKLAKVRDFDVVQAARAILADYGMGTRGEAAQRYLEAVQRNDPAMYQVLRDKVDNLTLNARPLNELTVEEFRGLVEEIHSLWQLAKRSRQIEVDGKLIDIEAAKLPLITRMEAIGIPDRVPGEGRAVTEAERRVSRLRSVAAALRRVESWAEAKDGQATGPFRQFVWQPVKEAADRYRSGKAAFLKRYRDLLASVEFPVVRVDAPELGYTFGFSRGGSGKAEILHALLHTGNESNKRKLLLGRQWGQVLETGELDTRRWDAFVNRMVREGVLTRADFAFVQGVWDLLEEMKPLAQKAHHEVFGRYFDEIAADGFTMQFPDGAASFRGGYVPAVMDPEVVKDAATRALQEDENATLAYAFPSTPKGFTKTRVEINRPLLLDLRYLAQHIDKVLLFSHLEQPIRDVRKVLTSKEVSEPLHRIDPAAYDGVLTPWMNRAARQTVETKVPGDNNLMRFFAKARSRAGMAAMFANVANAAQQITGLSIAAVKVRPGLLADATAQWVKAPRQVARAVAEASPYMASRMDNEVAAMNDAIEQILLNPSVYEKAQAWTAKHAYFLQSAIDNVVGPIVWTGAYNQALEAGHSEPDALRLADAAVRQTQGSTLPEDVSRIETGNAFVRLFTQFAGYFNMQANLLGTEFANIMHEQGLRRGAGRGLYVFVLGFMVPAMLSEVIVQAMRGGPDDEDKDGSTVDDWLMAVLLMSNIRGGLAMVPGAGQAVNAAINTLNKKPYDDRISTSPAISMIESAVKAPVEVYKAVKGEGSRRAAVRDLATLISMTTGLPATAAARPLGYLAGVSQDQIKPTGPLDTARGLVSGTPSPESKR